MVKTTYSKNNTTTLKDVSLNSSITLETIRKRPAMFIGSCNICGVYFLICEAINNAIDEVLASNANNIIIKICKDDSIVVEDNGRGISVELHESGVPYSQFLFCTAKSEKNFNDDSYNLINNFSFGNKESGACIINALSSWVELTIQRNNKIYFQRFENGGSIINDLKIIGETNKTGTKVQFKPDFKIFTSIIVNCKILEMICIEYASSIKGLKIALIDEKNNKSNTYYQDGKKIEIINEPDKCLKTIYNIIESNYKNN